MKHQENNTESQTHYEANLDHFTKQCKTVYLALKRGEKLTTRKALIEYGVGDLRRRVKDLKDLFGVPVKSHYTEGRYKVYYL